MNIDDLINEIDPDLIQCSTENCGQWLSLKEINAGNHYVPSKGRGNNQCPNCKRIYVNTNPLTWIRNSWDNSKSGTPTFTRQLIDITGKVYD